MQLYIESLKNGTPLTHLKPIFVHKDMEVETRSHKLAWQLQNSSPNLHFYGCTKPQTSH
jgi:hypothetical protein